MQNLRPLSWSSILAWLILLLGFVVSAFVFGLSYNEMDVLPYARAVYNPSWLAQDWYLSLQIPYRWLFSYPVGWAAEHFGFLPTAYVGRTICYALMGLALLQLIQYETERKHNPLLLFAPLLYFLFFSPEGGPGEWMIGGLETKSLAYAFALWSLACMLRKNWAWAFALAGLALSFHLLVGIYHLFCLLPTMLLLLYRRALSWKVLFIKGLWFIPTAAFGLYGIWDQLGGDKSTLGNKGWEIYVALRLPHHTLPNRFGQEHWILFGLCSLLLVATLFYRKSDAKNRLLALYGLGTTALSLLGLLFFWWSEDVTLMRYYFFRSSDVLLPLLSTIVLSRALATFINLSPQKSTALSLILPALLVLSQLDLNRINPERETLAPGSLDRDMAHYIRENTAFQAQFVVPPDLSRFYVEAERSPLVLWKQAPQSADDLVEWKRRLDYLHPDGHFQSEAELYAGYSHLNRANIREIKVAFPKMDYLLMREAQSLDLPKMYQSEHFTLYDLRLISE